MNRSLRRQKEKQGISTKTDARNGARVYTGVKILLVRWSFAHRDWIGVTVGGDGRRGQRSEGGNAEFTKRHKKPGIVMGIGFDPCSRSQPASCPFSSYRVRTSCHFFLLVHFCFPYLPCVVHRLCANCPNLWVHSFLLTIWRRIAHEKQSARTVSLILTDRCRCE